MQKQYQLEKKLAQQLKNSTHQQRKTLYSSIYNQLFKQFPNINQDNKSLKNFRLIKSFLNKNDKILEIGAGNLKLTKKIAAHVKQVFALEVSQKYKEINTKNIIFKTFNGLDFNIPLNYFDTALSFQVLEHLHPDDVIEHLLNIKKSLKEKGLYIIKTPHRFSGPHDISKFFTKTPTGLHLKEYTYTELIALAKEAKFFKIKSYLSQFGFKIRIPNFLICFIEKHLKFIPRLFIHNILIVLYS